MMDPLFGNYLSSPRSRMPVNRQSRSPYTKASKIVSIPVRFIESHSRSRAAMKIQKVFRGFLVRKSVKKIIVIKREIDEIEKRISQKETVDLIRRDVKEKLKVNEMLMRLLFRLDSIRGVGSGVRDCRKSVIRKAIMLQERIDSIAAGDKTLELVKDEETKDQVLEIGNSVVGASDNHEVLVGVDEQAIENKDPLDSSKDCEIVGSVVYQNMEVDDHVKPDKNSGQTFGIKGPIESTTPDECDSMVESPEKSNSVAEHEGNLEIKPDNGEDVKEKNMMEQVEEGEEKTEKREQEKENVMEIPESETELIQVNQTGDSMVVEDGKKRGDSKDLVARMMEGNEKLTGLVSELCERNASQARMITSLSQRVENLEKAYKREKLKRKNNRMDTTTHSAKYGRKS